MNAPIQHFNGKFDIAAFPCNQFDLQEPARNDEILNGLKYVRPGGGFEPNFNASFHIFHINLKDFCMFDKTLVIIKNIGEGSFWGNDYNE